MTITKDEIEKLRKDIDGVDLYEGLGIFGEFTLTVKGRCPHCEEDFWEPFCRTDEVNVNCTLCGLKFTVHLNEYDLTEANYITIDKEQN